MKQITLNCTDEQFAALQTFVGGRVQFWADEVEYHNDYKPITKPGGFHYREADRKAVILAEWQDLARQITN